MDPTWNETEERMDPLANVVFVRVIGGSVKMAGGLANAIARRVGVGDLGDAIEVSAEHSSLGDSVSVKFPRLDVRVVCERDLGGGARRTVTDIEAEHRDPDVEGRFLLYAAKEIAGSLGPGDPYGAVPDVFSVILYDGPEVFPDDPQAFMSTCRLGWDVGGRTVPGADRLVFALVEMRKFRRLYPELTGEVLGDEVLSWLYLLAEGYKDDEETEAVMEAFMSAEEFAQRYKLVTDDPATRYAYDQYLWSRFTEGNIERKAKEDARKAQEEARKAQEEARKAQEDARKAKTEGRAEGVESVIERLRAAGVDPALLDAALAAETAGE